VKLVEVTLSNELRNAQVYGVDVDLCDLVVGNLAEKKIPGFEISETAFLVFFLMSSRRLQADRFFTEHYNEKVYGKAGFEWIRKTSSLRQVLARHFPDLERELPPKVSCFSPYSLAPRTTV
jgi:alpha-dioxygenase